jgi:prevent-host-death family protein
MCGHKILVMAGRSKKGARALPKRRASTELPAADFKARCLHLMDRVRESGVEYVVTKHGRPVAKLVPYRRTDKAPFFGAMKGTVLAYERPFEPIDGQYDIDRD